MTEIGKHAQGLRGFPTPNTADELESYLLFYFPDSEWAQYVLGAVKPLTMGYNWYEAGDMSPDDAAAAFRLIVEEAPYNIRNNEIDAPFWDETSGDDTDDLATRDDQTWYGQWDGETFIESLAYVFLTNFLSSLVTTQGAIKFLTIPRTFRLLIKQNPHGAKLLLFLDGGLYAVINGYSVVDQVLEVIVKAVAPSMGFMTEDVEPLELMIVHSGEHDPAATPDADGNYTVDVIRGRLSEEDVIPPNIRYNPETDTVQFTPDGGTTWNDDTAGDVRTPVPQYPPFLPPETTDDKCTYADSVVQLFKQGVIDVLEEAATVQEIIAIITGILAGVLGFAGGVLTFVGAVIAVVANAIFSIGVSAVQAAYTETFWDDLRCLIYNNINADGSFSQTQLDLIYSEMAGDPVAIFITQNWVAALGTAGMTNAARALYGAPDAVCDCVTPTCAETWDWWPDFLALPAPALTHPEENSVQAEAVLISSTYWVNIRTPAFDQCCQLTLTPEVISGSVDVTGWTSCGTEPAEYTPESYSALPVLGTCLNHIVYTSDTPFTVKWTFQDCP